ncbi:MAG: apolipoprotein N-acyltransferase [Rhodobacteraceae bacterium]|nr:apolipoprotein N-acyltransferase [Paracoccaceae bacterium]
MSLALAPRLSRLPTPLRLLCQFALGAVGALSLAPFHIAPAILILLVAGFDLLKNSPTGRRAFATGWWLGTGYFAVALHWIVEPFQVEAAIYGWMAPFALAGMAGGLALFWGLAFWAARRLSAGGWALVAMWPLAELARAYVLTGFPWAMPSQALIDSVLGQGLSLAGPHGMILYLCLVAAVLALPAYSAIRFVVLLVACVALFFVPPPARDVPMTGATLRLVQPNAPQHEKWDPAKIPVFLNRQLDFAAAPGAPDWIVLPETALPYLMSDAQPVFDAFGARAAAPVITGIQREENGAYFNSLAVLDAQGQVTQVYDKHHLVPFGEYMPLPWLFRNLGIRGLAARADAAYTPGPGPELIDLPGLGPVLPLICYEAVFAQDARAASPRPNLLLHLTNDAWFGDFAGPQQHLSQARMRAIEQGLPVARAANTGISAMISPWGAVLEALPLGTAGYLDVTVPAPRAATLYARTGDLPWAMLLGGLTLGLIWRRRQAASHM